MGLARFSPYTGGGRTLLVAMGGCSSCSVSKFHPGDEAPHRYARVVLLFQDDAAMVRRAARALGGRYSALADPQGFWHNRLRANMTPRCYELDAAGRVVRAQARWLDRSPFLREAVR